MPLTSFEGIRGFQKRLADWLKSEFGQELNQKGLDFRYQLINHQPVDVQLNDFIKVLSLQEALQSKFEGFQSLCHKLLKINERINLQHFVSIGWVRG